MRILAASLMSLLLIIPVLEAEEESSQKLKLVAHFEDSLEDATEAIREAIVKREEWKLFVDSNCKIGAREFANFEKSGSRLYFVSTKDNCGSGAHAGPIWILEQTSAKATVLLHDVGHSLFVLNSDLKNLNLRHVDLYVGDTFGADEIFTRWAYDAGIYKKK